MLYKFQRTKLCKHLLVGGALFAVGFGLNSCTDKYDLDSEQPSGLNSIYGYMADRGNFQNYMRIIQDLGQEEILSKTGSKTLFLANDAAFDEFYKKNDWNVSCYEELTLAQKKILLGAAMIDNPYTTSMLSTAQGPVRGEVCRRVTSQTLYDTVDVVKSVDLNEVLPDNPYWASLRANGEDVVLFRDASMAPPVVHFTPKFVQMNKLTSEDIEFLYRMPRGTLVSDDVYVGRAKIVNANIFCKNGFIHEVDKVMVPLDNMAEIIRKDENSSVFSGLIERFAAPYWTQALTDNYNFLKGTDYDSVFVKRYFSARSVPTLSNESASPFEEDIFQNTAEAVLKFDPGWNAYIPPAFNNRNSLMEDMGVILAPTNEAMYNWWYGEGSGKLLRNLYGGTEQMENVPTSIVAELLNNNFLEQLTMSLPSGFDETVYDDANEIMGLDTAMISNVAIGCNGVVYYTDKVYEPASFRSVLFPAVVKSSDAMSVIYSAIDNLDYKAYLNSMVSKYSFFIPTNNGLLTYIDPVTYGKVNRELWQFEYDPTSSSLQNRLIVKVYRLSDLEDHYDPVTMTYNTAEVNPKVTYKNPNLKGTGANDLIVIDRLEDILDNIIVIGEITADKEYYPTKGRSFVRVKTDGYTTDLQSGKQVPKVVSVSGSWQDENNSPLEIAASTVHDNGYSFEVNNGVPAGGSKSVVDVLAGVPECSIFHEMLERCATSSNVTVSSSMAWAAGSPTGNLISVLEPGVIGNEDNKSRKIAYLLNGYHYTIYAPTNDAMQKAFDNGLPTLEELDEAEKYDEEQSQDVINADYYRPYSDSLRAVILDFVKYHIQDNSIYMDNGFNSGAYESAKIQLVQSVGEDGAPLSNLITEGNRTFEVPTVEPRKPYKITVDVSQSGITVTDHVGNVANVKKTDSDGNKMYNLQAREYWLDDADGKVTNVEEATQINTTSSAVIHAIDHVLLYDTSRPTEVDENGVEKPVYNKFGKEIKYNQFRYVRKKLASN